MSNAQCSSGMQRWRRFVLAATGRRATWPSVKRVWSAPASQGALTQRSIGSTAFDADAGRGSPGSGLQTNEVRGNPNPAANGGSEAVPPKCRRKAGGLHRQVGGLQPLEWPGLGLRDNGRIYAQCIGAHARFSEGQARWRSKKRTAAIRFGCPPATCRKSAGQVLAKGELCLEHEVERRKRGVGFH